MDVNITVVDVDAQVVNDCEFECSTSGGTYFGGKISGNALSLSVANATTELTIRVGERHPHYFHETVSVTLPGGGGSNLSWSNATCDVMLSGGVLSVKFVLSRIRLAPTVEFNGDILQFKGAPDGVLTAGGGKFDYRNMNAGRLNNFHVLKGARVIGKPNGDNWDRLNHTKLQAVSPVTLGQFRWLEYGPEKRYAVAVWMPPYDGWSPGSDDFILFYTPTTKGKDTYDPLDEGHTYPYGLKTHRDKKGKVTGRNQTFMYWVGHQYLFERLHLAYQLAAARKRAIIVLPINNLGDFGPFTHEDGIHRLLLEVAHFARKNQKGRPSSVAPGVPLRVGKVIVAGYSSGIVPLVKLFSRQEKQPGPSYVKNQPVAFAKLWTELWDVDLAFGGTGEPWLGYYKEFLKNRDDRRIRMYHSQYTLDKTDHKTKEIIAKWRPSEDPYLNSLIKITDKEIANGDKEGISQRIQKAGSSEILAEEYLVANGRWSIVYCSETYLTPNVSETGKEPPYGWNGQHDFTVNFAFGHAASLSGLSGY